MSKAKKGAKGKPEVLKVEAEEVEPEEPVIEIPEVIRDVRPITISIQGYRHINRSLPISDLSVIAKYLDKELGESEKVPVTDDEVVQASHEFTLECDLNSSTEIDTLISNPVEFTVWETYGSFDISAYSNVTEPTLQQAHYQGLSVESEEDLFKSFVEVKDEPETLPDQAAAAAVASKKGAADAKGKKTSRASSIGSKKESSSKASKKGESKTKEKTEAQAEKAEEVVVDVTPRKLGTCTLDLIPLFLGQNNVMQTLTIVPCYRKFDENMIVWKELPKLAVCIAVEEPWKLLETKLTNILGFTVESMYNIPNIMTPEMEYCVCSVFPTTTPTMEPVILSNAIYRTTRDIDQIKFWPNLPKTEDLRSATNYRIDANVEDIQNNTDVDLNDVLSQDVPRIEWNYLRRRYVAEDGCAALYSSLKKYRRIVVEVIMKTKDVTKETSDLEVPDVSKSKGKVNDKSSVKLAGKAKKKASTDRGEYLHLMAIVDISALLYPGVNKLHVACPLTTFHEIEALEAAGLKASNLLPKQEELPVDEPPKKDKKARDKSAESKSSKASSKKGKSTTVPTNLAEFLPPPPPPPPEPSTIIYNENGERTFIIVELELLWPISKKREIEDLHAEIDSLFPEKPSLPKEIVTSRLAGEMYRDTIRKLSDDLNQHYVNYTKEAEQCGCSGDSGAVQADFLTYLNRIGVYPTYLSSLTKAAAVIVKDKFAYSGRCDLTDSNYQSFISEVFAYLIKEMNTVLNEIVTYGLESKPVGSLAGLEALLLYAKEACELGADHLAERYHLERTARDEKSADRWFDYAVFLMEIKQEDRAYECARKALTLDLKHRYSMLLAALLLSNKKNFGQAETCFLSLTSEFPFWLEGWGSLITFYKHICNFEGEQACLAVLKQFTSDEHKPKDYFISTDDLAWTASICPEDDVFFRTSVLLIKLRCFHYAEIALSYNIATKKSGIVDYLAAVICYYRKQYDNALLHLKQAEKLHGLDYGTASLKGHCLLATGCSRQALIAYLLVLESYNRPDDIHMVYVNASIIYESVKNFQEARKLMLLACKYSPTPYTWLTAGLLYYKQNDLISSEACLTEANTCDRKLPEIWSYLTLVNAQLERSIEAEFCFREARKLNLIDQDMLNKLEDAIRNLRKKEEQKQASKTS